MSWLLWLAWLARYLSLLLSFHKHYHCLNEKERVLSSCSSTQGNSHCIFFVQDSLIMCGILYWLLCTGTRGQNQGKLLCFRKCWFLQPGYCLKALKSVQCVSRLQFSYQVGLPLRYATVPSLFFSRGTWGGPEHHITAIKVVETQSLQRLFLVTLF